MCMILDESPRYKSYILESTLTIHYLNITMMFNLGIHNVLTLHNHPVCGVVFPSNLHCLCPLTKFSLHKIHYLQTHLVHYVLQLSYTTSYLCSLFNCCKQYHNVEYKLHTLGLKLKYFYIQLSFPCSFINKKLITVWKVYMTSI